MIKKIIFVLFAVLILVPIEVFCADHYASPTGSATWANSSSISTPCSYATAFSNAAAGDIVYFRGGTYTLTIAGNTYQHGAIEPSNSGTSSNQIVFKSYPGETPLFDCTNSQTWDNSDRDTQYCAIFGINFQEYITFDGFYLQANGGTRMASINVTGTGASDRANGVIITNCDINGGTNSVTVDTNNDLIRLDNTSYAEISYNSLYDNKNTDSGEDDTCAIKMYDDDHVSIKNNEIKRCNTGIYLKRNVDDSVIEYNWVEDMTIGIRITPYNTYSETNNTFHDNLITNVASYAIQSFASESQTMDGTQIYNNTIYASSASDEGYQVSQCSGLKFYNNIVQGFASSQLSTRNSTTISEADHNNFGPSTLGIAINSYTPTYTSLSSWQSSNELSANYNAGCGLNQHPGCGSLVSDPLFANGSGNLDQLSDFALATNSPCKETGRSGVDMGADISLVGVDAGTENIGQSSFTTTGNFR